MNILILGGGGREHALAWAVKQNPKCNRLIVAPGNAGIAALAQCSPLDVNNKDAVLKLAQKNAIDFVIVGPEAPLVAGIADDLRAAGILCFGPSAAAAQLESSKAFTKKLCDEAQIPTARYRVFDQLEPAQHYLKQEGAPIVIKANGLAAGKGVTVATDLASADQALQEIFTENKNDAQSTEPRVVIEEFMDGEEVSLFVLANGLETKFLGTAQDHKRAFDGDQGPNTGGMGAYSPAPLLDQVGIEHAMETIIQPTLRALCDMGTPYQGILYAGLMIKDKKAKLVEYNVRFGDPECQVLMLRLGGQVLDLMQATAENRLAEINPIWADDHAITVVMAAQGYPGPYRKGEVISGLEKLPSDSARQCFHAGTKEQNGRILSAGGRVLNMTARGTNLKEARIEAYKMIDSVEWDGGFCRTDIGWRVLGK